MSRKSKTILLLILAIGIWGYSALEWINYANASDSIESTISQSPNFSNSFPTKPLKTNKERKLILDYTDPFLGSKKATKRAVNNVAPVRQMNTISSKVKPLKQKIKWPNIIFSGVINKDIGLLKIGEKDYLVKKGDVVKGITVLEISDSNVLLEYKTEELEFKK